MMGPNSSNIHWYCGLFLFITLLHYTVQYQHLNLESDEICSAIKKRKIKLYRDGKSGLMVRQNRLNDHSLVWETSFRCKFELELGSWSDGGIIAVIQHLSFRKNSTGDCLDYVQFVGKDGSSSPKFCGRFNAALQMDKTFLQVSDSIAAGNAFVDYKGEMTVHIYVNKEPLKPEEEMDLDIAFTAYRNCPFTWNEKKYDVKPCTPARKYCIYSGFFNDSIINCPSLECVDEMGCSRKPIEGTSSDQIFYGALSSVFISFFIFIICIFIIKARKLWCFNQNCYQSRAQNQPQPTPESRTMEMRDQTGPPGEVSAASAPTPDEDKDLPPAYETLFPER